MMSIKQKLWMQKYNLYCVKDMYVNISNINRDHLWVKTSYILSLLSIFNNKHTFKNEGKKQCHSEKKDNGNLLFKV